jgi:hypothetical protein
VVEALDVYANDAVKVFSGRGFNGADVRNAGVVDENRETFSLKYLLEECSYLLLVGNITAVSGRVPAFGSNLLARCFGIFEVDVRDANRGSMPSEPARDRAANSAATARDDGYSAVEPEFELITCLRIQRETPRFQGMKSF